MIEHMIIKNAPEKKSAKNLVNWNCMQKMMELVNQLPGIVPNIRDNITKLLIFRSFPDVYKEKCL